MNGQTMSWKSKKVEEEQVVEVVAEVVVVEEEWIRILRRMEDAGLVLGVELEKGCLEVEGRSQWSLECVDNGPDHGRHRR